MPALSTASGGGEGYAPASPTGAGDGTQPGDAHRLSVSNESGVGDGDAPVQTRRSCGVAAMSGSGEGDGGDGSDDLQCCAACGESLPDDVWCPARTVTDDDEVDKLVVFCDEDCEAAWNRRR